MKKTPILGLAAVLVLGLVATAAFAMPFWGNGKGNDAVQEALESGDYDAYLVALEEQYQAFLENEASEEMFNQRVARHQERTQVQSKIDAAMSEGYDAWIETVNSLDHAPPMMDAVTEDNFDTFVAMHQARQGGDWETAKALADELGFGRPEGCQGFGKGGHRMHFE